MPMRGIPQFSIEFLKSNSTEKLRRGTRLSFKKFVVSKIFMDKRGGGGRKESSDRVSRFPIKIFLYHSAGKFRGLTLQSFISFGYRKFLCL